MICRYVKSCSSTGKNSLFHTADYSGNCNQLIHYNVKGESSLTAMTGVKENISGRDALKYFKECDIKWH